MALLGFLLTSTLVLFTSLLASSTKTTNLSVGTYLAEQKLEEAIRRNQYWPVPTEASTGLYSVDSRDTTQFWQRLETTPISGQAGQFGGAYLITVEVWWWSKDPRHGQGRLSTRLSRLHYVSGMEVP